MSVEWIIFTIIIVALLAVWAASPRAGGPGVE